MVAVEAQCHLDDIIMMHCVLNCLFELCSIDENTHLHYKVEGEERGLSVWLPIGTLESHGHGTDEVY